MAKFLCICIGLTKFKENPEGSSIFCVDLTWNDPIVFSYINEEAKKRLAMDEQDKKKIVCSTALQH